MLEEFSYYFVTQRTHIKAIDFRDDCSDASRHHLGESSDAAVEVLMVWPLVLYHQHPGELFTKTSLLYQIRSSRAGWGWGSNLRFSRPSSRGWTS
jgi:hypothetical protein